MTEKDEIVDTAQFAAELKALAKNVVESKVKTKPLTKQEIIASDDVWNAIKEMREVHGMTMIDIAEVFKAKGGIWANSDGKNMGQLIRNAEKLRGGETESKKARKPRGATRRSSAAISAPTSEASGATIPPALKSEGAAEGKSKHDTSDAKPDQNPGAGSGSAGTAPKKKVSLSALDREA
ncbi:hypothetical protein V6R85_24280 [Agrobacterium sp. CCNWLW32]|uniref:hypothetical protein n=1 Tax=Agrobacterium sp. CCNWLW32 TaxID=3122072 RepID=UPI0030101457